MCLPLAALAGGDEQTTADFDWEPVMEAVIQVESGECQKRQFVRSNADNSDLRGTV